MERDMNKNQIILTLILISMIIFMFATAKKADDVGKELAIITVTLNEVLQRDN